MSKRTMTEPRTAVLKRLAAAYDRFAESEQLAVAEGHYEAATIAHGYCLILLRAYHAEDRNPEPRTR